jgi:hypothetical protein
MFTEEAWEMISDWPLFFAQLDGSKATKQSLQEMYLKAVAKASRAGGSAEPVLALPADTDPRPRLVIMGDRYYARTPTGYSHALVKGELKHILRDAQPDLNTKDSGWMGQIQAEVAEKVIVDITRTQASYFDKSNKTMYETPLRRKDITAKHHPEIEEWLRLMARDNYEKLTKWMALFPDLTKTLCAIQLEGPPGCGKSLFVGGLSKVWNASASDPQCLTSPFNEGLTRCPLVEIDEEVADNKFAGRRLVSILRSELSKNRREIRRKFLPPGDLLGCIRVMLTGNHNILETSGHLNADSIQAISERILYIKVDRNAVEYLKSVPGRVREAWASHAIAEHVAWLEHTIGPKVEREGRFWVLGEVSRMTRILAATGVKGNSLVSEWIVTGLLDAFERLSARGGNGGVVKKEGGLYIHTNAIVDNWSAYSTQPHQTPSHQTVTDALKAMGSEVSNVGRDRRLRFVRLDPKVLAEWAVEFGAIDGDAIQDAIEKLS